ncbi:aldolase [Methanocalculus chunghsingensis]|uniref:Aldolase n=1 Tax=Methanocalculus chunghsingensis TaxID=156457 RepID=A0A8J7WAP2_9EURY|nr:aldolase [Methanocalculus chunghsingensis]MBR1369258.1 aldolase [Methanocalculus chunghsingensis]
MGYDCVLIDSHTKDELLGGINQSVLYEVRAEIYGCCVKLMTDSRPVRDRFAENFFFASQSIRSHGRLYVLHDALFPENTVRYDRGSKTVFLFNMTYYGWVKSIALGLCGDILEDGHGIASCHGACLDRNGEGFAIIGMSGAGKTTQTYGFLLDPSIRVIADDWFFFRIFPDAALAYSSEKNFYIRADLAAAWPEFEPLMARADFDEEGRAIVDLRYAIGKGRIFPLTTLRRILILTIEGERAYRRVTTDEALSILEENRYFNPHLLVKNDYKTEIRREYYRQLLERVEILTVARCETPGETQELLRTIVRGYEKL